MEYLLLICAYLLGSVPFGLLFARSAGIDVRKSGSGNIGATNVGRLLGRKLGVLTLLADCGKGALPPLAAGWLLRDFANLELWLVLSGAAAFVGHLFPVYLRFKGGKGVATALGVFLVLCPWAVAIAVLIFAGAVLISGYVSVGSLMAAGLMPVTVWSLDGSLPRVGLAMFMALLIWLRHMDNIDRLFKGKEKSFRDGAGQG
ncbi:MAG: glycerol-3-phosphate 1-O-acyltransferase PlsY [Desulfobacterales bacterium]|nr:glycerol-3-phosphate 1-O-acyltransferase PlsY [Desulfobacterales bacterium]